MLYNCCFSTLYFCSDSASHQSQDICPPISQIVLKNFIKISLIFKECHEDIFIKLAIVLEDFKVKLKPCFCIVILNIDLFASKLKVVASIYRQI
jgi:hypothetical protein